MSNSFDADAALAIVEEIEAEEKLMESSKMKHASYCRERRDAIKDIKKAAKEDGFPEDVINALLKTRKNNAENKKIQDGMSNDYRPIFIPLAKAIGNFIDLPLGQAAAQAEQETLFDENEQTANDISSSGGVDEEAEQREGEEILKGKVH